jgi:tetratricopeptide (TPR) repeat protein
MTTYGLGGSGKSALALEFAYRALTDRAAERVFWVPAISRESFELAYREIATSLHIPGISDSNANINKLVKDTLSADSSGSWLMIVDNADDPAVLQGAVDGDLRSARLSDFLPRSLQGAILFTTRSRKAARTLTPDYVLELKDMSQAEARQLLVQRVTEKALLDDLLAIEQLLSILAYLPLAIVQAAAFMNSNETPVSDYVSLFEHAGAETELFSEQFEEPSRYEGMDSTIAKTWHISFAQIRRQDPLAADYLAFIACIDRTNVPQSLLPSRGSRVQQIKALGTLTGYAFITERQQTVQGPERERFFDMHRLVYLALVAWLQENGERAGWVDTAISRLNDLVPYGGHERQEVWVPYLSHAIHIAGCEDAVKDTAIASLLERVGQCQTSLGQYAAAEVSHRQASSLMKEMLGFEHPGTLMSMSNLAGVLDSQGKYEEAEAMNRQTLALQGKVLGHEHPDTLSSMNNLALVLDGQGKYEEAETINRQMLARSEKALGHEHPSTLASMNNLAEVLGKQGKYEEAEARNRQTLAGYKKVLGSEHPDMLRSMSNLALVLNWQGKYEEAEAINRQTLARREQVLGYEHPDTLSSMSNLALVLDGQGKYEEAETINRQTLAGHEKVLGYKHPSTLTSRNNLATVLNSQGKYEEAEAMHRRTLAGHEKALGHEHPSTLLSMGNLAEALDGQGKYKEAEKMNRQTLARYEKALGPKHPDTLTSMGNLAQRLGDQGKYEEAEAMHRQQLAICEKVLGYEHPESLGSVYRLAYLLAHQHRYNEALPLYKRACAGYQTVLGKDHPTAYACRQHYADALASVQQIAALIQYAH